jgi:hypothetical protein
MSRATLAKLATIGGGPPFVKCGRYPIYDPVTLTEWVLSRTSAKRRSTSET